MNGCAVDRKRDGFAHAIVARSLEYQRDQLDRRRRPGPPAVLREPPHIAKAELDDIGFVQLEIERLVAQASAHLDLDGVEKRPPRPVVFIRGEDGARTGLGHWMERACPDQPALRTA